MLGEKKRKKSAKDAAQKKHRYEIHKGQSRQCYTANRNGLRISDICTITSPTPFFKTELRMESRDFAC